MTKEDTTRFQGNKYFYHTVYERIIMAERFICEYSRENRRDEYILICRDKIKDYAIIDPEVLIPWFSQEESDRRGFITNDNCMMA